MCFDVTSRDLIIIPQRASPTAPDSPHRREHSILLIVGRHSGDRLPPIQGNRIAPVERKRFAAKTLYAQDCLAAIAVTGTGQRQPFVPCFLPILPLTLDAYVPSGPRANCTFGPRGIR